MFWVPLSPLEVQIMGTKIRPQARYCCVVRGQSPTVRLEHGRRPLGRVMREVGICPGFWGCHVRAVGRRGLCKRIPLGPMSSEQ